MPSQPEQLYRGEEAQEINPKIDADYLLKIIIKKWILTPYFNAHGYLSKTLIYENTSRQIYNNKGTPENTNINWKIQARVNTSLNNRPQNNSKKTNKQTTEQ